MNRAEAAELLGVSGDADRETIMVAYRRTMLKFHPDRHPDATDERREQLNLEAARVGNARDALLADRTVEERGEQENEPSTAPKPEGASVSGDGESSASATAHDTEAVADPPRYTHAGFDARVYMRMQKHRGNWGAPRIVLYAMPLLLLATVLWGPSWLQWTAVGGLVVAWIVEDIAWRLRVEWRLSDPYALANASAYFLDLAWKKIDKGEVDRDTNFLELAYGMAFDTLEKLRVRYPRFSMFGGHWLHEQFDMIHGGLRSRALQTLVLLAPSIAAAVYVQAWWLFGALLILWLALAGYFLYNQRELVLMDNDGPLNRVLRDSQQQFGQREADAIGRGEWLEAIEVALQRRLYEWNVIAPNLGWIESQEEATPPTASDHEAATVGAYDGHDQRADATYDVAIALLFALEFSEAAVWMQQAALEGDPRAQYALGSMYMNGYGLPVDPQQGMYWQSMAMAQGFVPQAELLRQMGLM